ncbi:uncharacterized protein LOC115574632 isoform X1 [Sparus aurata]|uniref:uncharacterized protein LOC115574632 isoform X1 n=1 Tax=Sparus aurata TaxID=8175 RepID=UPI0011C117D0|nr:uncharacterized protein LOC115574632 isoform X1 [Sparus aurata]
MEDQLQQSNLRAEETRLPGCGDQTWVKDKNLFFNSLKTSPTASVPLHKPGEKQAEEDEGEKATGPDTISSCLLKSCANQLCRIVPLRHEPEAGKCTNAVENLLRGTCTKDPSAKRLQQLQNSCSHFTTDEDPGVAGACPPPPSGWSFYGPTPVCLPTWHRGGRRHHLPPGQITFSPRKACKHCEDHVLCFLQCFQHHTACTFGGQAEAHKGGPTPHVLDPRLPHQPATVSEDSGLLVRHSCLQYGGPTGNNPRPFPVHSVHCRLLPPFTPLPSTKVP